MSELNDLTLRLYAMGYTREHHPDFVYWSDFQNLGYQYDQLLRFTWETPCGLLIRGDSGVGRGLVCEDTSFGGVWYCPENDNPLLRCPYDRTGCAFIPEGFPIPMCPCHLTQRPYDYRQSVERVEDETAKEIHRQYMELTGGAYCACVVGGNGFAGGRCEVRYDVDPCNRDGCKNTTCVIRKQARDLSRVNVFYDIRRTWITRTGFLEERKTELTKGVKVFKKAVARTDAELWLQMRQAEFNPLRDKSVIDPPKMTPEDRNQAFFSKMHRRYGDYDYFEFHYKVENIRIARSEQRDLLQDLRDVAEGIEVFHAVDLDKDKAARKRERRQRARERKHLRAAPKAPGASPPYEQMTMFQEGA